MLSQTQLRKTLVLSGLVLLQVSKAYYKSFMYGFKIERDMSFYGFEIELKISLFSSEKATIKLQTLPGVLYLSF